MALVTLKVLPQSLELDVALASSRLTSAAGIAEGADLDSGTAKESNQGFETERLSASVFS